MSQKTFITRPLSFFTDYHAKALGEAGVIEVIVEAMKEHIDNAELCEIEFNTLVNITINGK